MPRVARKNLETPFLHVMVQGINKEYIFYKEEYICKYLEIMSKEIKNYNFEILAYCMMNNHAHFLVYTENIKELGKFMQKVNLVYAQMYNKNEKRCGVLFRNRYQTEPIYDTKYLINCIKYIHNNPVKANIVSKCADYKYSSYNDYINNIGISQSNIMKKIFGSNCDYNKLFDETFDRRYMDIDDEKPNNVEKYIMDGIVEFCKIEEVKIYTIFENRKILIELINFLKENCKIKYAEIQNFFEMSRGIIDKLKQKSI